MKKKIVCFGDSNTWGQVPTLDSDIRVIRDDDRWTKLLSDEFEVCEEGLIGRTTDFDCTRYGAVENGWKDVERVVMTCMPYDYFIVMLGSNDLQPYQHRTYPEMVEGLKRVLDREKEIYNKFYNSYSKQIVISPPKIHLYQKDFPDVKMIEGTYLPVGCDYLHLDSRGHERLAEKVRKVLRDG